MFKTNLIRIIKTGFQNFWRNSWLAAATISIIVLTLFVMTSLVLLNVVTQSVVTNLQGKVDISAYFHSQSPEQDILSVRQELMKLHEVKSAEYVSKDEALKQFKETHKDNPTLMQSLSELDENPLQASLNIKAQSASQYASIVGFLGQAKYSSLISKVNYHQNEEVINRVSALAANIGRGGIAASFILALMAFFVTFNTIRLTMFNWKDEIAVMRLVGGGNWYIRGPFVVEGMIYGILSAFITILIMYPVLYFVSPQITSFLPEIDLLYFFEMNILEIVILLMAVGMALGSLSSLIAIRRYLKV